MIDVNKIRKDFKIYENIPNLVYLDSGATSLTPDCVVEKMNEYYYEYRATVHRTKYSIGTIADNQYTNARQKVAKFINANEEEVIFTKGTTNSLNLVAKHLLKDLSNKDSVLISELEHHSNVLPWREFGDNKVKYIKLENHKITLNSFIDSLDESVKIVSLNHVSNVMGDITPIKDIALECRKRNITLVVDGAQAITHEVVDVKDLDVDFYCFSSHKMCGPTGVGVCYINSERFKDVRFEYGGDMTVKVTKDSQIYAEMPVGLEAGTPNIAEVIGLGQACDYLSNIGLENISKHVYELKKYLVSQLSEVEGITIYNSESHSGIVTFNLEDFRAHDVLQGLENANESICIRGGHMCNLLTLNMLEVKSVLRVSIYLYNNKEDIDEFISAISKVSKGGLDYMLGGDLIGF